MADKETGGDDGPSLELPSFGLRRKRRASEPVDPSPEAPEPDRVAEEEPAAEPTPDTAPVAEAVPPPAAAPTPRSEPAPQPARVTQTATEQVVTAEDAAPRRRTPVLPAIGGLPAAAVTGLVIGILTVAATWASLRLCEVVQGTSSCGDPGFFLLLAIAIVMVVLGQWLLSAFGLEEAAGSTSFLGVGLIAVIALVFLVELLFAWWMALVIPVVGAGAYTLSHWVTTNFVDADPGDDMHR
ncbi:hypothetical protein [Nocardioides coralli]|uniref:hypothetical protein n=1 Tax=Nocardioides coralli TaxID=2872154 RepID=UPI001CA40180|nr:hypothetical protein [Nocardioides coralli]QZY29343.1 hypothetical protein K6T13_01110 [Nocardioides coralli]